MSVNAAMLYFYLRQNCSSIWSANTEMLHSDLITGFQRNEAKDYAYQKYTVVRNDSQIAAVSKYKESFIPAVDDTKQRNHLICIHHPYSMCQHCGSEWISAVDPTWTFNIRNSYWLVASKHKSAPICCGLELADRQRRILSDRSILSSLAKVASLLAIGPNRLLRT